MGFITHNLSPMLTL